MHAIQQQYWAVRDYLSPVLKESKFREHGRITPEEFVAAGDFLAYKFPVWSWEAGDASKAREYLPANKQYMVTRGVPCLRRATSLAYTDADEDAERLLSFGDSAAAGAEADEWVETHAGRRTNTDSDANPRIIDDIPDLDGLHEDDGFSAAAANLSLSETPDLDDIPDMEEDLEDGDDAAAAPSKAPPPPRKPSDATKEEVTNANLLSVRTYDVMITYDKYYQTPRIWLLGYDEASGCNGTQLVPDQIFQDVTAEHAFKTVTIEAFPHSASLQAASVHPCKHASVMRKLIERMNAGVVEEQKSQRKGGSKDNKKKWLFKRGMFLKFIASIVPTIEVDSTAAF
ncbi:putative E2-like enzyme [Lactarius deliciosus]|nr:putative E2-like enzyme [Lactarius deliciosus]